MLQKNMNNIEHEEHSHRNEKHKKIKSKIAYLLDEIWTKKCVFKSPKSSIWKSINLVTAVQDIDKMT